MTQCVTCGGDKCPMPDTNVIRKETVPERQDRLLAEGIQRSLDEGRESMVSSLLGWYDEWLKGNPRKIQATQTST